MRAFKVVKDPVAFQLLADETRRKMIYFLRAKEMTVSQLAAELDRTPQAIYHHIRKLRDAGLVEVGREERVDHFIETYYRAAAEVFYVSHGEGGPPGYIESRTRDAFMSLDKLGLQAPSDAETVSRIVELEQRIDKIGTKDEMMDQIAELEGVDFILKQDLAHYVKLLSMTDDEFDETMRLSRELRTLLRSRIEAPAIKAP